MKNEYEIKELDVIIRFVRVKLDSSIENHWKCLFRFSDEHEATTLGVVKYFKNIKVCQFIPNTAIGLNIHTLKTIIEFMNQIKPSEA